MLQEPEEHSQKLSPATRATAENMLKEYMNASDIYSRYQAFRRVLSWAITSSELLDVLQRDINGLRRELEVSNVGQYKTQETDPDYPATVFIEDSEGFDGPTGAE